MGIAFWVVLYAWITSTDAFYARWADPTERLALYITYGLRMLMSLLALVVPVAMIVDMYCGMLSIMIVTHAAGESATNASADPVFRIVATTFITIIQGGFLSILTFFGLLIIRAICGVGRRKRHPPRGFEVLPMKPVDSTLAPSSPVHPMDHSN